MDPNYLYLLFTKLRKKMARRVLPVLLIVALLVIVVCGFLILLFEKEVNNDINTYGEALWFTFVTMTTIGAGSVSLMTLGGKLVGVFVMAFGIAMFGAITATFATYLIASMLREGKGLKSVKCSDHIIICGWNPLGEHVIRELKYEVDTNRTAIVILENLDESPVSDPEILFVHGNEDCPEALLKAGADRAKVAIILADFENKNHSVDKDDIDARTVLTALAVRGLNPDIKIAAEILDPKNIPHVKRAEVSEILVSGVLGGSLLARSALHHGLTDVVHDLATSGEGSQIYKIKAPSHLVGLSYGDAVSRLQTDEEMTIIALQSGEKIVTNANGEKIADGDSLFVIAESVPREDA